MNNKVWNEDKTMMIIVNETASRILSLADGNKSLNEILKESYSGILKIEDLNTESLEKLNLANDLNDRFLQTVSFCISMWERDLMKFKLAQTNVVDKFISPIINSSIDSHGEINVEKVYSSIRTGAKEQSIYHAYNQYKSNIAMLLAYDILSVSFNAKLESYDQEVLQNSDLPQFKTGYLKPSIQISNKSMGGDNTVRLSPMMTAIAVNVAWDVAKTAAAEAGTMAGDIVGRMESR